MTVTFVVEKSISGCKAAGQCCTLQKVSALPLAEQSQIKL